MRTLAIATLSTALMLGACSPAKTEAPAASELSAAPADMPADVSSDDAQDAEAAPDMAAPPPPAAAPARAADTPSYSPPED